MGQVEFKFCWLANKWVKSGSVDSLNNQPVMGWTGSSRIIRFNSSNFIRS